MMLLHRHNLHPRTNAAFFCGIFVVFCTMSLAGSTNMPQLVANISIPHPAVADIAPFGRSGAPALVVGSFYPTGVDAVRVIENIDGIFNGSAAPGPVEILESDTQWPNQATIVRGGQAVLTACGFFVSSQKSTGSVDLFDVSNFPAEPAKRTKLSDDRKENFYHKVRRSLVLGIKSGFHHSLIFCTYHIVSPHLTHKAVFLDVDGDGDEDVVSARAFASTNPLSKAEGEMMWFDNGGNGSWTTHYLTKPQGHDGPDVSFEVTDLDNDGVPEFVASQFFTVKRLAVWSCNKTSWSLCENGEGVTVSNVDTIDEGGFFSVQWIDLNLDGKRDLLATTNMADGKGAVYAYELIGDFQDGPSAWKRHIIATGYAPIHRFFPPGQGSPGAAIAFQQSVHQKMKPTIMVSADDGGWIDILFPSSDAVTDWTYDKHRLITIDGTIGSMSTPVPIVKGGAVVFAVPLFAEGIVQLYKF